MRKVMDGQDNTREAYLWAHLESTYGIQIEGLTRLERGVFAATLGDRRRWVVRIFPTTRAIEQVEGDAAVLRFLEREDFPAERCAVADAVSVLQDRGTLVTAFVEGTPAENDMATLQRAGAILGRLATMPCEEGAVARAAGALHHYAPSGGPETELVEACARLAAIEERVPMESRALYESLRGRLAAADDGHDLPQALIHPDPVLKNLIATPDGELIYVDWTGAGRGPRLASLAVLLWTCALLSGGWSRERVDAIVAGYRTYIQPEERELERLAAVMRNRPLIFAGVRFRHAIHTGQPLDGSEWWWPSDDLAEKITAHARAAFA